MPTDLHRPSPLNPSTIVQVTQAVSDRNWAIHLTTKDDFLLVNRYDSGVEILSHLQVVLNPPRAKDSYQLRTAFQLKFRHLAKKLIVAIQDYQPKLQGGGAIGFLKDLYPQEKDFFLSFVDVQELYGAWKKYKEGTHFAVLGHSIFPYFGTYAPTRVSHLELFATWLHSYQGKKTTAVDVGTGCGILAFMLSKRGFANVFATDNNPNAIHSVNLELKRSEKSAYYIQTICCDLLTKAPANADLIVFNPPWMMGKPSSIIDGALYFEAGLFPRFFAQAWQMLSDNGRIAILFSNIIQLVQPTVPHPIASELSKGRFTLVKKIQRRVKPSKKNKKTKEKVEVWELAKRT